MDCQICGTQLPSEARACPNCGTPTPAYFATSGASAYDPTIPAASRSSPSGMSAPSPPPTPYGANPYGSPLQSPYPVNPYEAPPPPPPQRPGNRIGIIAGVVLLVLLLIAGGVFAWLAYSSARNAAAATAQATATAQAIATATATFTANGAFTVLDSTNTNVTQNGQDTITSYIEHGMFSGDLTGAYTLQGTNTVHPDKTGTGSGIITCTCTVSGKSGTLRQSISYTIVANGSFQGQVFDFQGTGDLANLHGQGTFQGQGSHGTYSDQMHFGG